MAFFKKIVFLLLLISSLNSYSQIDNKNEKKGIEKVIIAPVKELENPKSLKSNSKAGFKNAYANQQKELAKKKKEDEFNNKGILTKTEINKMRFQEMYGKREYLKVDKNLGSFLTNSKIVTVSFQDFGQIDNDIIAVYHNNIPIISKITLSQHYKSFQLPLEDGENKIEILALNQGTLGANTARLKLVNSDGILISSNYWFLATGAKATLHITKSK